MNRLDSLKLATLAFVVPTLGWATEWEGSHEFPRPTLTQSSVDSSTEATTQESARMRELPGLAKPIREVVVYPPIPGLLSVLPVREGDRVGEGQLLADFEDGTSRAAVEAARLQAEQMGSIEFAQAELRHAEKLLERLDSVDMPRGISRQEVDMARSARDKAAANLRIATETSELAQAKYVAERSRAQALKVVAPFEALVSEVMVEPGQRLFENTPMARLVDLRKLTAVVYVPWDLRDRLKVGATYPLQAGTPVDSALMGQLVHVDPVFDAALQAVRCRFVIDNESLSLPAGFLVKVDRSDWKSLPVAEDQVAASQK